MTGEARRPDGEEGPLSGVTVLDASRVLAGRGRRFAPSTLASNSRSSSSL